MKYKKLLTRLISGRKNNGMTTVAVISGLAAGVAIGALFATNKGRIWRKKLIGSIEDMAHQLTGNTRKKANAKLGNLIVDVRHHVKQNAEGLKGNDVVLNPLG